jgi:hypothetical protein
MRPGDGLEDEPLVAPEPRRIRQVAVVEGVLAELLELLPEHFAFARPADLAALE